MFRTVSLLLLLGSRLSLADDQEAEAAAQARAEAEAAEKVRADVAQGELAARHLSQVPPNLGFAGVFASSGKDLVRTEDEAAADEKQAVEILFEATQDDKKGTLTVARKKGSTHFGVELTGALDKGTKEAVPLSLDGLSSGAVAAFNVAHWWWPGPNGRQRAEIRDMCAKDVASCSCQPEDLPEGQRDKARQLGALRLSKPCSGPQCGLTGLAAYCLQKKGVPDCWADLEKDEQQAALALFGLEAPPAKDLQELDGMCREAKKCPCGQDDIKEADRQRFKELHGVSRYPKFIGATVEAGRTGFEYLATGTLASESVNHNDWAATIRIGTLVSPVGFFLSSYSYAQKFKPGAPARDICRAIEGTAATACSSAVIGEPKKENASVLTFELRRMSAGGVGIAPSVQRDFEAKVTSFQLPIYFATDKAKALTGGVRLGFRTDDERPNISVFVGTAFSLVPK